MNPADHAHEPEPPAARPPTSTLSDLASSDCEPSPVRILLNFFAVIVAGLTVAPLGIFVVISRVDRLTDRIRAGFWLLFLSLACLAALLPRRRGGISPTGTILTLIILTVTLLNLGGCLSALRGFGRATGA